MFPIENLTLPAALPSVVFPTVPQPAVAVDLVRVLHIINGQYYAGAERVQDLLAKRLPELGFSVGFACVKLDLFDEMRQARNVPLYDVSMWGRFDLRAAGKIANLVRREDYRLIHGHTVRTALIGSIASRLSGAPMVYHAHSPATSDSTRRWANRFNGLIERLCLRQASRVIAVSQALAEHVAREGFDPARIRVVPNGVPESACSLHRAPPSGCWTLGAAALFRPRKGIEVLLDALAFLRRQGVPVHLRAVGSFESPKYAAEIAAQAHRLGLTEHITWTGFTRDMADELSQMDLFVLPSLFGEGLPMVVLEAMAAGVPVVAASVPGVPEAIRHGQDGVLVAPGDAAELCRAIAAVVRGDYDWSALRRSAQLRHAALFSDRAMAAGVAAVYRELLGE